MRGIALYLLAGILVVLAMDFAAPPVGLGLVVYAWPAERAATTQFIDRTHKGDRLSPALVGKQRTPAKPPAVMIGCEPLFSPLSASARTNNPDRCFA
jgi:hypothetical protein